MGSPLPWPGSLRSATWAGPAAEAPPGWLRAARSARRSASGGEEQKLLKRSWGQSGRGTRSGSKDTFLPSLGICRLPAGTRPLPRGSPPPLWRHDVVAGAQPRQRPGLSPAPRQCGGRSRSHCSGLPWALPTRARPPGSRLWGSGRSGRAMLPAPGRGEPTRQLGKEARPLQPQRGSPRAEPSAAPTAVQGADARGPPPATLRDACTCLPNGREGRRGPRRAHDNWRPRLPARLAPRGCSFTSPRAPGPRPKGVPARRPVPAPRGLLVPTSPHL